VHHISLQALLPQITHIRGEGNYATVHFVDRPSQTYALTLARLANHLPQLVRIHKSYLVNPEHVVEGHYKRTNEARVLVGEQWLPISRRRAVEAWVKLTNPSKALAVLSSIA
jgi:DNA-binding LytR/AlgR family response regulator